VTPANAANESLHAFWDGLLGDRLTPDQAISMAAALPQADPADGASLRSRSTRTSTGPIRSLSSKKRRCSLHSRRFKAARAADDGRDAAMIAALKEGFDDFVAMPTYPAFVDLFYARSGFAIVSF
jgi:hypothetical protein